MKELKDFGHKNKKPDFSQTESRGCYLKISALCHQGVRSLMGLSGIPFYVPGQYQTEYQAYTDTEHGQLLPPSKSSVLQENFKKLQSLSPIKLEQGTFTAKSELCLITGNETEALFAVFQGTFGSVVLTEGNDYWFFSRDTFPAVCRELETYERAPRKKIPALENIHCFYDSGRRKYQPSAPLNSIGAEGILFKADSPRDGSPLILKYYLPERTEDGTLFDKLKWMVSHKPEIDCFAWPEDLLYDGWFIKTPVGYSMKRLDTVPMERALLSVSVTPEDLLDLAVNLVKNVLFLHLHGILAADFNPKNFHLDSAGRLMMLDCGGYIVKNWGSTRKAPLVMGMPLDYSGKSGAIRAEYFYLWASVFYILSRGVWPYSYQEGSLACITQTSETHRYGRKIEQLFRQVLKEEQLFDPEVLLCALLDARKGTF